MLDSRRDQTNSRIERNLRRAIEIAMEPLESRQFLSASPLGGHGGPPPHQGGPGGGQGGPGGGGGQCSTIEFSVAPAVVQTGLDALATADGLTDPAATDKVQLNNVNGVETYSVTINGTGTVTKLTVDQLGDAVTAPTETTTTWATLSTTNTAASAEITAIATALDLTAPVDTTVVRVSTTSSGAITYSVHLAAASTTTTDDDHYGDQGELISVDASGNPVGNEQVPFSVLSATIQNGLNSGAPTGATALTSTSTQKVGVQTVDGVVTYSTKFTVSGVDTQVTVNASGTLTSLPTTTTTTFSALSTALQTALQTLATADGVTTTIAATQSVTVLTETNGTVLYSVRLAATDSTSDDDDTDTQEITVTVDASGNPTVLPHDQGGLDGGGQNCSPPMNDTGTSSNSSSGTTTSNNSSSGSVSINNSGSSTESSARQVSTTTTASPTTYTLSANVLASAVNSLGSVGGYFVLFAPGKIDAAVKADLTQIATDQKTLLNDTRALNTADKKTLKTDQKAIAAAIKAINAILAPLEKTEKTDVATWSATFRADQIAIRKDKNDATALTAAQAKLATDKASAFAAIAADRGDILTAINSNSGVIAAQAKLTMDLPTIAADTTQLQADQSQLTVDIEAE